MKAFRNDSTGGRKAIALRLTGTKSNRDAIGARVAVHGRTQFLQAGSGYMAQHTKVLYFAAQEPADVRIEWPSGLHQELRDLAPGFRYQVTEGSEQVDQQPFAPRALPAATAAPLVADNQPRTHDTWLLDPVPLPDQRPGPGLLYIAAGERPLLETAIAIVDLRREPADVAAGYALFRRYLLDWRTDLVLPLVLLIDDRSRVHKLYAAAPTAAALAADLKSMRQANRQPLALPFSGDYFALPRRNYFKLGAGFANAGYPEQALPYLEEVVRQTPRNQVAVNAIGQIHADAGRYREAKQWFQKAIALKPDDAGAINNLGVLYGQLGQPNDAIAAFEYGIGKAPRDELLYLNLARIYTARGDFDKARAVMLRLREQKPDSITARNALRELENR